MAREGIAAGLGFIIGFTLALEIGRTIYNRKMLELREHIRKLRDYLDLIGEHRV